MNKGSIQQPTNAVNYTTDYDTIFGRKYQTYNICMFCGTTRKQPCHTSLEAKECFYYNERLQTDDSSD